MKDINKEKLITLYARNKVGDITANRNRIYSAAFPDIEKVIIDDPSFIEGKDSIEKLKEQVEHFLPEDALFTPAEKLVAALTVAFSMPLFAFSDLDEYTVERKMKMVKELLFSRYKDNWDEKVTTHYNSRFDAFVKSKVVFISYTNDDAYRVNLKYKNLIEEVVRAYGSDRPLTEEDWQKRNLVAMVIAQVLIKSAGIPRSKIFFDRNDLTIGDPLENILHACDNSLQFLQLVSRHVFVHRSVNWTYKEYDRFSSVAKRPMMFTLLEPAPMRPPFFNPVYTKWYSTATTDLLYKELPVTMDQFVTATDDFAHAMKDSIFNDLLRNDQPVVN